jgi:hypothetical protein
MSIEKLLWGQDICMEKIQNVWIGIAHSDSLKSTLKGDCFREKALWNK